SPGQWLVAPSGTSSRRLRAPHDRKPRPLHRCDGASRDLEPGGARSTSREGVSPLLASVHWQPNRPGADGPAGSLTPDHELSRNGTDRRPGDRVSDGNSSATPGIGLAPGFALPMPITRVGRVE